MNDAVNKYSKQELVDMLTDARNNSQTWQKAHDNKHALIDELNKYRIKCARLEGYIDRVLDCDAEIREVRHEDQSVDVVRIRGNLPDDFQRNKPLIHTKDRIPF